MVKFLITVVSAIITSTSATVLLEKIKDTTITCDYLIVCPEEMSLAAIRLAEHRNSYTGDDVGNARVAHLEDIIIEFTGTDYKMRDKTLWHAVNWAVENWKDTLKYLVLIGDDAFKVDTSDSMAYSIGKMPTWYREEKASRYGSSWDFNASDDYFGLIPNSDTLYNSSLDSMCTLYIGRIPAPTTVLCSAYIEKVIRYDLFKGNRSWKNSVLALADDNYQKELLDPVSSMTPHQSSCDIIADTLKEFFIKKVYSSAFPFDQFYTKPDVKKAILNQINNGVGITYYFGHGHTEKLSDEEILTYSDFDRFENDSMPTIFFSFSCDNGDFMPQSAESMCKRYLLKDRGGCIAYFGSRIESYAYSNEMLGKTLFKKLKNNQNISLGQMVFESKKELSNMSNRTYYLLGDPALRCFSKALPLSYTLLSDTINPSTLRLGLPESESVSGESNYYIEFSFVDSIHPAMPFDNSFVRDSVFYKQSGVFQNTIDIDIPACDNSPLKSVVFVWNNNGEGRAEIQIGNAGNSPVVLAKSKISSRTLDIVVQNNVLSIVNAGLIGNKTGMVKIFDLKGCLLANLNTSQGQNTVNLSNSIKSSGRYILMYCAGETQIRKSFMVLK